MASFEDADSAFAARPPLLSFAEPSLLLMPTPFYALGGVIGNGNSLHSHITEFGFAMGGVESSIASHHRRYAAQAMLVDLDSGYQ